jgi:hypothetical protein
LPPELAADWSALAPTEKGIPKQANSVITGNLVLPDKGPNGSLVSWESTKPQTIKTTGEVSLLESGATAALVATLSYGGETVTKVFKYTVEDPGATPAPEPAAYLMAYFVDNGSGQQNYLAVSEDAYQWDWLNGNKPIFSISAGSQRVRDQCIVQNPVTGKYYLMGTDLNVDNGYSNKALLFWESDDLVNWANEHSVQFAGTGTIAVPNSYTDSACVWAPEAIWDPNYGDEGGFMLYWTMASDGSAAGSNRWRPRFIVYSYTTDFMAFTTPRKLYQVGDTEADEILDASILEDNGTYYMFFRHGPNGEAASSVPGYENGCGIYRVQAASLPSGDKGDWISNWTNPTCVIDGTGVEGPHIFKLIEPNGDYKYMLFIDWFGYSHYGAYASADVAGSSWTEVIKADTASSNLAKNISEGDGGHVRHAGVIKITKEQYDNLRENYSDAGSAFTRK